MLLSILNQMALSIELIAGVDEAGRGCLAGPVVAAAVVWPSEMMHPLLKDSKQLNTAERLEMYDFVVKHSLDYCICAVDNQRIDVLNILNATFEAMNTAIWGLKLKPDLILVDGNRFKNTTSIAHRCEVKGDARFAAISAASILAKTQRDWIMQQLSVEYPDFQWDKNMGYPTALHRKVLLQKGHTPYHRRSFKLKELQLDLGF